MISDDAFGGTAGEGSPDQAQDIAYGGSGDLGGGGPGPGDYFASESPGTKALVEEIQKAAAQKPPGVSDEDWKAAGKQARADTQKERAQINAHNAAMSAYRRGETLVNPQATWWDWITAPVEIGGYLASRALTGGLFGLDLQLGKHDVTGYKGRTDVSHAAGGVKGPQNPGIQVDVGIPGVSGILGPIAPDIATVDLSYGKEPSIHSTFDPDAGTIGKTATDFYGTTVSPHIPDIPGLATGGLASLPQISQSGLYRAMGRG